MGDEHAYSIQTHVDTTHDVGKSTGPLSGGKVEGFHLKLDEALKGGCFAWVRQFGILKENLREVDEKGTCIGQINTHSLTEVLNARPRLLGERGIPP